MKRILGFILAFLILGFSIIPCADGESIKKEEAKYELAQSIPHNNDQNHNDACSPFCICSCCAGFSVVAKITSAPTLIIPFQSTYSSYIPERLYSIALPVWQPPQLV